MSYLYFHYSYEESMIVSSLIIMTNGELPKLFDAGLVRGSLNGLLHFLIVLSAAVISSKAEFSKFIRL